MAYFLFQVIQYCGWVFTLTHHNDCFYCIFIIGNLSFSILISYGVTSAHPSQAWNIRNGNIGNITYQYRYTIIVAYNDVFDLINVFQQTDTPDRKSLVVLRDHIAANVDIGFLNGGKYI